MRDPGFWLAIVNRRSRLPKWSTAGTRCCIATDYCSRARKSGYGRLRTLASMENPTETEHTPTPLSAICRSKGRGYYCMWLLATGWRLPACAQHIRILWRDIRGTGVKTVNCPRDSISEYNRCGFPKNLGRGHERLGKRRRRTSLVHHRQPAICRHRLLAVGDISHVHGLLRG